MDQYNATLDNADTDTADDPNGEEGNLQLKVVMIVAVIIAVAASHALAAVICVSALSPMV